MTIAFAAANRAVPSRSSRWTSGTYFGFLLCRSASGNDGCALPAGTSLMSEQRLGPAQVGGLCNSLDPVGPVLGNSHGPLIRLRNLVVSNRSATCSSSDACPSPAHIQRCFSERSARHNPAGIRYLLSILCNTAFNSLRKMHMSRLWSCQVLTGRLYSTPASR